MTTEMIQVGALSVRFVIEADDSNGSASVFECFIPADSKMPAPHSHDAFEETIYGLAGVTTWTVDGRTLDIRPGKAFCIPRGAVPRIRQPGDRRHQVPCDFEPRGHEPDYFREALLLSWETCADVDP